MPSAASGRLALLVALAALLLAGAGSAQDDAQLSAYKGWSVTALEVTGLEPGLAAALRVGLALRPPFDPLRRRRPRFFPRLLSEDLARARLFLARSGYPRAAVTASAAPNVDRRELRLTLHVRPGAAVRVAQVTVTGSAPWDDGRLRPRLPLREGSVFTDAAASAGRQAALTALLEAGHALAEVRLEVQPRDSTRVDLRYVIQAGPRYRFGELIVEGASPDLVPLVRKSAGIARGMPYSPRSLQEARDRLRLLDLFRQVRLETVAAGGDTLDLRAKLMPRKPRELEGGIGYWSDEFLRGRVRWRHRNLFRAGRGLDLRLSASKFLVDAGAQLTWPSLLGSSTRASLGTSVRREWEPNYDLIGVEARVSASYLPDYLQLWLASLTVANYRIDSTSPDEEILDERDGLLSIFSLGWRRNNTDDRLQPSRGTRIRLRGDVSLPGPLSNSHYALVEGEVSSYANPVGGVVVAGRFMLGIAAPLENSKDLLANKRFYAGGESSMRGFGRRRLGPKDAQGSPRGGRLVQLVSGELRFPVWRLLNGALFADAGQVWRRPGDASFADLELAIGPGLQIRTPVGPIRADWGYRLTDAVPGEPRSAFHLSIGQPF